MVPQVCQHFEGVWKRARRQAEVVNHLSRSVAPIDFPIVDRWLRAMPSFGPPIPCECGCGDKLLCWLRVHTQIVLAGKG